MMGPTERFSDRAEDNPASARTIEKCGGILWDKTLFEGKPTRRYWMEPDRGTP